jgi:hypothetical protein
MPTRSRRLSSSICTLAVLAATAAPAAAQTLEAPPIAIQNAMGPTQLATGRDGAVVAVGDYPSGRVSTRLYADVAPFLRGGTTFDDLGKDAAVTALPHGGFAAAWTQWRTSDGRER